MKVKPDTGASSHYFKATDSEVLSDVKPTLQGPVVTLPNLATIQAKAEGQLNIHPSLTKQATTAHVFDNLTNTSLLSVGQLCDDDCTVIFDKVAMKIVKNGMTIIKGKRNTVDGLWDIELPLQPLAPVQVLNAIIKKSTSHAQLADYLYACCGSPPLQTFLHAIKNGNMITWPGIREIDFNKHLTKSIASAKGHLNQERKNLQTTQPVPKPSSPSPEEIHADHFPEPSSPPVKTYQVLSTIIPFEANGKAFHDLTGRFPHKSSRGNEYLLVHYDYDSNGILAEPLKNRQSAEIKRGWQVLYDQLAKRGNAPSIYIMDNEASAELKAACDKYDLAYQLVPPHVHRRNTAERAIQCFKNHLLAIIAAADPNFPISEWDRLVGQAVLTLNILRNSRVNCKLSAHAYLFGNFDFNATPLAPPGTRILLHLKPDKRPSWGFHGEDGWYIGPSLEHYRCVKCFMPATAREKDADTVEFFPHKISFPVETTDSCLRQAATDIVDLLRKRKPSYPSLQYGDEVKNALSQIATLLNRVPAAAAAPPTTVVPPPNQPPLVVHPPRVQPTHPPRVPPLQMRRTRVPRHPNPPPAVAPPRVQIPLAPPMVQQPMPQLNRLPMPQPMPMPMPMPVPMPVPMPTYQYAGFHRQPIPVAPPPLQVPLPPMQRNRYFPMQGTNFRQHSLFCLTTLPDLLQPKFHSVNHIFDEFGKKQSMDKLLNGPDKDIWWKAIGNEFGRLAQGIGSRVLSTDTIDFICKNEVPQGRKVTYGSFVCDHRQLKAEPYRVRLTVGGDKLEYESDAGSPAASLVETKLTLNSTISDAHRGARFMSADLKDFFLATTMEEPEYMRIPYKYFPHDVRLQYDLESKVTTDGYIYVKIKKGMYGLKQAAVLAYDQLVEHLAPHGYFPCPQTTGIWRHKTRQTRFCLCVDDFGIKYFSKADADHLLNALKTKYKISTDWAGKNYYGLTLDWNYTKGYVDISMPGYIDKALERLQHVAPKSPQFAPHRWTEPSYGSKVQLAPVDTTPLLDAKGKKYVQSVTGTLAYYSRGVDPTMQPAINEIAAKQANPTESTLAAFKMLLDYAYTYPNAKIRFYASKMILTADTDAAYLVQPNARSRYAGYFYLTDDPSQSDTLNGAILVVCRTLRGVMRSAAEAECAGVFHNSQEAIVLRTILEALGHPQPPTRIKTDNSTANSFVRNNIRQRRSKTWDMRWNWLRDDLTKAQIKVFWDRGINNDADYYTKHHPPAHHKISRPKYILQGHNVSSHSNFNNLRFRIVCARVCSGRDRYTTVFRPRMPGHSRVQLSQ